VFFFSSPSLHLYVCFSCSEPGAASEAFVVAAIVVVVVVVADDDVVVGLLVFCLPPSKISPHWKKVFHLS
jgi:hypothetical protein